MPLLVRNGVLLRSGNALMLPPQGVPGCICCPRYECLPGSADCRECRYDVNGQYRTLQECEQECEPEVCVWCVEFDEPSWCDTTHVSYTCVATTCDEDGICILPELPVVAGPVKAPPPEAGSPCDNIVCPEPPPPPPEPECCNDGDCGCCRSCLDGDCIDCPPGTVCIDCECVVIEDTYYCCRDPYEYGQPEPTPYCQRGPCAPPAETIGGPYRDYGPCCLACGCSFSCAIPGYYCHPDPLGPYATEAECLNNCVPPPDGDGACCYTIAPHSEDNETCTLIKGCFGVMSFDECEALKTTTGTNTSWYEEYDSCSLCPVTESSVCCHDDPESPCAESICEMLDESCCDEIGGTLYLAVETCEDLWPSGLSACRDDAPCTWPAEDQEQYFELVFKERKFEYTPAPPRPIAGDPPCIGAPQWNAGWPAKLDADCLGRWRWVRSESRCHQAAPDGSRYGTTCVRYRLMAIKGARIIDLTPIAISNPQDLECCACTRNGNWAECLGNECVPLTFLDDPEANCLP